MSIDFTILCTRAPGRFLARKAHWLKWSGKAGAGSFAGMSLERDGLRAEDPLPAPDWADRVVAVVRASGRLSDDSFDDFDSWTTALADATQGAVYSHVAGEFIHVWSDVSEAKTLARLRELLAADDPDPLARWIDELAVMGRTGRHSRDAAKMQLEWIAGPVIAELTRRISAGDVRGGPVIDALQRAVGVPHGSRGLNDLVLAAVAVPDLPAAGGLFAAAARITATREIERVRALPPPTSVAELVELLEASERGDRLGWPRLEDFLGYRHKNVKRRQALVVELARSGRAVAPVQIEALAALVGHLEELTTASGRDAFARHGELASAIARLAAERLTSADRRRRAREQDIERRVAEYDALYGRDRKRPRMPEDLIHLIRCGKITAAVLAYRERFPAFAAQAALAVEDARAFYVPGAPGTS